MQSAELLGVKAGGIYSFHWAFKIKNGYETCVQSILHLHVRNSMDFSTKNYIKMVYVINKFYNYFHVVFKSSSAVFQEQFLQKLFPEKLARNTFIK
jgi:hypothetical protein